MRASGVDARVEDMKLTVSHQAMEYAQGVLHRLALRKGGYLVCFLSTRWPTKVYPYRHWASVLAKLSQRVPMVLMGTSGEAEIAARLAQTLGPRVIDLVNQTSIPQMVAMVADSGGVICPDSAANFIAPALGVDVVIYWTDKGRANRSGRYECGDNCTSLPLWMPYGKNVCEWNRYRLNQSQSH